MEDFVSSMAIDASNSTASFAGNQLAVDSISSDQSMAEQLPLFSQRKLVRPDGGLELNRAIGFCPTSEFVLSALNESAIVAVTDVAGTITQCNELFCKISGYAREELVGQNHRILKSELHDEAFFRDLYRIIACGNIWRGTICNRRKDGMLYWVDTTIVPQLAADRHPIAYLAIRFDVTAHRQTLSSLDAASLAITVLRQKEEELIKARGLAEAANRAKSQFLASMSHELRTPLNAIIGFAEIIKDQAVGPMGLQTYIEYAGHIYKSGAHLLSLINDVLDLSKIESGNAHIVTDADVNLTLMINDCCQTVGVMAKKCGVILNADISSEAVCVRADGRMIRQILINLMSNAVKFTPEKGAVTVRMRHDPVDGAIIEVSDTGIGMTATEAKVALEPFGQINSHHSRQHKGTGLGLPLALSMIELHGGRLQIKSIRHEGTTVSFNIPNVKSRPTVTP
jgi:PAS domain S-box-containing protein